MADTPVSLLRLLLFNFILAMRLGFGDSSSTQFIYQGFNGSDIEIHGGRTAVESTGALRLTDRSFNVIGRAVHPTPITMFLNTTNASSFSTYFVFQIRPGVMVSGHGGHGLGFTISPTPTFAGAASGHNMGVFNPSNDGNPSNHIFMVEFDTVRGHEGPNDNTGSHVAININGMRDWVAKEPASYHVDGARASGNEGIQLEENLPIQAWIDYDGAAKILNVTLAPIHVTKPTVPLISKACDLSPFLVENMYVGFSAATGQRKSSSHYILVWSFSQNAMAYQINPSLLPTVLADRSDNSNATRVRAALIASSSTVLFILIVAIGVLYRKTRKLEDIEDWELDCPHRFRYEDLHKATKGFKASEILGVGGYGAVYKGVLPSTGAEVAVKKIISNDPVQGTREFAAEVESLGRLRHKNLVNLQGWCKQKNNLLLIYEYVPNGSLESLLFNPRNGVVLSWVQRFNILKGVAYGLLYLHEEWEKVVIHRDVKSSNVLIDKDMDAKLGDFGLARLHDRGETSRTTNVVGTVGYIAPELTWTGKPSTSTDVFAFGTLLLEVASGRQPVIIDGNRNIILIDWVAECWRRSNILEAADEKLGSDFSVQEMELVLKIGLLCSNTTADARPSMKQVVKYLNGDESLPEIIDIPCEDRRRASETTLRFMAFLSDSNGSNTTSYGPPTSFGSISVGSLDSGR